MKSKLPLLVGSIALVVAAVSFWPDRANEPSSPPVASADASSMDPVAEAEREPGREDLMAAAAATAEPAAPPESADSLRPVPAEVEPDALVSLPEGELKSEIEALPARARREALRRIARLEIPAEDFASLRVTGDGKLYYVNDIIPHGHHHGHDHGGVNSLAQRDESQSASITAPTQAAAAVPIATPPVRHSRPGSTNVLYLDFSGHTVTNTSWNSGQGDAETYIGKVYDTDGDPTTFSDDEQADIIAIWERVAEDFSPFDVNVTTEEPAVFTRTTGRGLVTASVDGNGVNMPSHTGGGVAQLDVFGESDYHTRSSPAFVYYDNFSGSRRVANIAEAMSHELGHNMGLTHDGQNGGVEYYGGHGTGNTSWGPIMGTGYGQNVSQWSKGEYFNANNTQDDFALMEAKMGYATDEAGDTTGTAAAASIDGSDISNTGVISSSGDVDLFSFNTATGTVTLNVNTFRMASSTHGGNADLKLELLDSGGAVVATHAPAGDTNATISLGVTAGTYYARISPEGDGTPLNDPPTGYTSYGSAGQYTLTGTIIAAAPSITSTTTASVGVGAEFSYAIVGTNGPSSYAATGLPAGLSVDTNSGVISGRATETGAFSVSLSATNSLGTGNATLTLTVTDAAPVITAQTSGRVLVAPGDNPSFSTTVISANGNPTYGWKRNGQTLAGQTSATLDLTNVTRADHGYYQVMVTNSIGTTTGETIFLMVAPTASQVVVWGDNEYGQTDVPVDLGAVAQLEFGSRHAIALMRDGSLRGWGSDSSGQATVPDGITEAVQVATGSFHGLVLLADGTVQAWGNDFYDQATPPDGLAGVVSIAAGNNSSYAVKSDGTVVAWGRNDNGQSTVPGGLTDVVAIAAGNAHAIAAKADGSVVAWGLNTDGQTSVASGATSTAAVSTGDDFSIAHQSDGSVVMWGENVYGQQTLPDGLTTFAEIIGGAFHTVGLKPDGTVAAWGYNFDGQIEVPAGIGQGFNVTAGFLNSAVVRDAGGDLTPSISTHPVSQSVVEGTDVTLSVVATGGTSILSYQWRKGGVAIDGATASSLSLPNAAGSASGDYDVVVSNQLGSITSNVATLQVAAIPVISAQSAARSLVQPGQTLNLSVTATGTGDLAYQWHRQGKAIDGATSSSYSKSGFGPSDAGVYHVTITDSVGTRRSELMFVLYAPTNSEVIGWGLNDEGQTTIPGGLDDAIAVTSGTTHALALKRDGTVVAWGSNHRGERDVPGDLTNVVQIAAGFRVSYALKSDGTVVEWGSANFTHTGLPDGLSDVIDISYYIFHGIALKADGTVAGWGQNNDGEITIPSNLGQVTQIAAGSSTSYALNDQGELFAWGNGNNGETTVPAASSLWIDVTGGGFHAVGLKSDGTAEGWGFGPYGDPPNGLTGLVAVSAGRQHVLGLSGTGLITAWGANNSGEGDVPSGLDDVFSIAAGYSFSLAIKEIQLPTAPAITTQPESVTVAAGASASFTVAATGFPAPTYQWRKGGVNIDGATSPTFSIGTTAPENAGSYDVVVSNDSGSVNSDTVTLTVQTAPSISAQPQSQTVTVGTQVTLTVTATGDPAPTYQWRKGGVNIDGETSTSLNLGTVALTVAGDYDVVVTNAVSSVTSSPATLTVQEAPAISAQPQPQTVLVGADVTLTVTASGTPAPTYQWRKDGVNIDGATGATLQLIGIATDASGSYDVVVSNEVSSVTSDAALITVQFAPAFSIQPQTQTVNSGANVTLSVAVSGVPAPTLQWRKDGQNISGATAAILDLGAVSPGANGTYDVVATNSVGSTTSAAATLTVLFGPSINTPPTSQTVEVGDAVTFTVSATGDPTPTYQWRKDGVNINGATSASFTIASVALDDAADYDVVVTNSVTSETSAAATLTVNEAPAITTQPESQTVTAGTAVTLTVTATGSPAPTYQWSKDGSPIDGATAASLDLGNIALDDAGNYTVVATNVVDAVTSAIATVAVQVAPEITTQPESQTVQAGTSVAFTVEATGTPSPSFQWRKDGVNIAGETSSSLGLSGVGVADAGSYTVAVFNDVETVVSETATLTVVSITGTHVTNGYRLGDGVTVSNTVTYTGTLTQLIWSVVPPAEIGGQKWSLSASSGTAADVTPNAGTTDLLEWTWNTVPASPFTFAYTLTVPDATAGDHNLAAMLDATSAAGTSQIMATPDPLVLSEAAEFHSADTSGDFRISLSELLRVIEIYNTRLGTTRTGRYKVDETTTDGFAPDPTGGTTQSSFHSADTNRDSQLSLSELLRVIEIYNTREGTTRTGEYHVDDNTVDGFAPGPLQ